MDHRLDKSTDMKAGCYNDYILPVFSLKSIAGAVDIWFLNNFYSLRSLACDYFVNSSNLLSVLGPKDH